MSKLVTQSLPKERWLETYAPDYKPATEDPLHATLDAMDMGMIPVAADYYKMSKSEKLRFIKQFVTEEEQMRVAESILPSLEMCRICKRNAERRDVTWPPCRNPHLNSRFHFELLESQGVFDNMSAEERFDLRLSMDPVVWAESEFSFYDPKIQSKKAWKAFWYQEYLMLCTNRDKTAQWGRRMGKSEMAIVKGLHAARYRTGDDNPDRLYGIHVFVHSEALKEKHFSEFKRFIDNSVTLGRYFKDQKKDELIKLKNESEIKFSVLSTKSALGQSAKKIWFDEAAYYGELESIISHALGLRLEGRGDVEVFMTSNSSGFRGKFYQHAHKPETTTLQLASHFNPDWNLDMELTAREEYTEEEYTLLVLAEWGESSSAVFSPRHIEECQRLWDYTDYDCRPEKKPGSYRVLGCDWNEGMNGVHFVIIEYDSSTKHHGKPVFKMIKKSIIVGDEWTHERARIEAFDLMTGWDCDAAYLDKGGGGSISVPDLKRMLARAGHFTLANRVVAVDMGAAVEVPDPLNPAMKWRLNQKNLVVRLAQLAVQQHRVGFPKEEYADTNPRARKENVVPQMRDFKVERVGKRGVAIYSSNLEEHTLTAWMLALMGCVVNCTDTLVEQTSFPVQHRAFTEDPLPSAKKNPEKKAKEEAGTIPIAVARNKHHSNPYTRGLKGMGLGSRTKGFLDRRRRDW